MATPAPSADIASNGQLELGDQLQIWWEDGPDDGHWYDAVVCGQAGDGRGVSVSFVKDRFRYFYCRPTVWRRAEGEAGAVTEALQDASRSENRAWLAGDEVQMRWALDEGSWRPAAVEKMLPGGQLSVNFRQGGFMYFCRPSIWRVPLGEAQELSLEDFSIGEHRRGVVSGLRTGGILVGVGGVEGLVPWSHVSAGIPANAKSGVSEKALPWSVSSEIDVWVMQRDGGLQLTVTDWWKVQQLAQTEQWMTGEVLEVDPSDGTSNGRVIVKLEPGSRRRFFGILSFLSLSEGLFSNGELLLRVGHSIKCRVVHVDVASGTCYLTSKLSRDPVFWAARHPPPYMWLEGKVTGIRADVDKVSVKITPPEGERLGAVGTIHESDLNGFNGSGSMHGLVRVNESIRVRVKSANVVHGSVELTTRPMGGIANFERARNERLWFNATVLELHAERGLLLHAEVPGAASEGWLPLSQINTDDFPTLTRAGSVVGVRVIDVVRGTGTITFSMFDEETQALLQKAAQVHRMGTFSEHRLAAKVVWKSDDVFYLAVPWLHDDANDKTTNLYGTVLAKNTIGSFSIGSLMQVRMLNRQIMPYCFRVTFTMLKYDDAI